MQTLVREKNIIQYSENKSFVFFFFFSVAKVISLKDRSFYWYGTFDMSVTNILTNLTKCPRPPGNFEGNINFEIKFNIT